MNGKFILLLLWAVLFQFIAYGCCVVPLVGGGYGAVLIAAMAFTLLACAFLVVPFRRGGMVMKILCGVVALPTMFVVLEFIRRAPHAFGL